ncbi:hypothetical protein EG835_12130, partial [bacterium]|nr:hypothetical protein [bacterium]
MERSPGLYSFRLHWSLPLLALAILAVSVPRPANAAGSVADSPSLTFDGAPGTPQGFSPWALALTRDGQSAYVSFSLSEVLFKVRLSDMSVQAVADLTPFFPTRCQHIALSPDESRLFGVIPGWRQVIVIDTATMKVIRTIDGIDTAGLFLSQHTGKLVTWAGGTVRFIDPGTYAVTEHRSAALSIARIIESPSDPSLWYVVHSGTPGKSDLVLYRHADSTVTRTIPLPDHVGATPVIEMRVTPDEKKVFIGLPAGRTSDGVKTGTVNCVDLQSGQVRSVTVPGGFSSMELSPDSRRLWVGGGWPEPATDVISVIDTASDAVVGMIPVEKSKYGWFHTQTNCLRFDVVNPNRLYATSTDGNSLYT